MRDRGSLIWRPATLIRGLPQASSMGSCPLRDHALWAVVAVLPQPIGENQEGHAKYEGVSTDPPGENDGSGERSKDEQDPKNDR